MERRLEPLKHGVFGKNGGSGFGFAASNKDLIPSISDLREEILFSINHRIKTSKVKENSKSKTPSIFSEGSFIGFPKRVAIPLSVFMSGLGGLNIAYLASNPAQFENPNNLIYFTASVGTFIIGGWDLVDTYYRFRRQIFERQTINAS